MLCLWFGFAMHSFGFFVWHQREREREQDQTFMLERRTRDSRNDVELSPSGIARYVDLEIESFTGNISLYFAFTAATTAKAANAIVSLFRVESSGGAATLAELLVLLLLVLIVVVNNRNSIFWLRFFLLCILLLLLLQQCGIWLWVSCAFFWIFCVAVGGVDGSGI